MLHTSLLFTFLLNWSVALILFFLLGQWLSRHFLHSFPEDGVPVLLGFFIPYQHVPEKHILVLEDTSQQQCQYLASKLERPPRKREGKILKIELGASVVVVVVAVEIRRDKTVVGGSAGVLSGYSFFVTIREY